MSKSSQARQKNKPSDYKGTQSARKERLAVSKQGTTLHESARLVKKRFPVEWDKKGVPIRWVDRVVKEGIKGPCVGPLDTIAVIDKPIDADTPDGK